MPHMGQHMAYSAAGSVPPQYMQLASAGQAQMHSSLQGNLGGPMQPQAIPFTHATEQHATATGHTGQSSGVSAPASGPSSQGHAAPAATASA